MTTTCVDKLCNSSVCWLDSSFSSWTFQILGNPFFAQNHVKLIKTPYLTQFPWNSSKTTELWMSQATRFLHDMWFYFQFLTFKNVKKLPAKLPQKKCKTPAKNVKLPQIPKRHTINFPEPTWSHHWLQTVWQMQGHWEIRCNSWNSDLY